MHWLQALDTDLFRFVNSRLSNPFFDTVMPFLSGNPLFFPAVALAGGLLIWKGGRRGLICVLLLLVVVGAGDGLVCNTLKHAVGRVRPCIALEDVHCLVGKTNSGSMPSAHTWNWFAATMVFLAFYRRSLWVMLPLACAVGFSRVYNGVHYPGDVMVGAILGAGYAAAALVLFEGLWGWGFRRLFPLWWARMPSLTSAPAGWGGSELEAEPEFAPRRKPLGKGAVVEQGSRTERSSSPQVSLEEHWLRLGYILVGVLLLARWFYIASGAIQLAEDEAYQWVWSKHLALSYFSKPPLIAYTQALGTAIWGDNAFGVRFFSPLITAIMSIVVLRFFAREVNARAGFLLVLIVTATPLLAVGAVLMTVDPLSVLFWTAAMLAGWRAVQEKSRTREWVWVGVWMGLGFLSKYTELLQLLCWAVFFVLWVPARRQLRRPGPYVALLLNLLLALPVLIWNAQHGWITVHHVAVDADAGKPWHPTLRFLGDFLGTEAGLLNPVFFVGTAWAAIAFWRRRRQEPRLVYFFSMGAPLFLVYVLQSLKARVLPNWIAPSIVPLFCLMAVYWDTRWRLGKAAVGRWLTAGCVLGLAMVLVGHNTNIARKVLGHYLPVNRDPLHRVREWDTTAQAVETARQKLLSEGKPVFIITDHYGMAGQISFYLPEARAAVRSDPLVYCRSNPTPENQFYYWPGYDSRKGQNAIYVLELNRDDPTPQPPPERLQQEFESVTDLGVTNVLYHGQYLLRPLHLFACRNLR
ncbi:MAG TPA: glycosyltransferase family 39 protein [Verrucomicrobiae bacterium]|nr:glycosyltransferase family 39 protein [Verrucomicrobiae bacterium]